MSYKQDLNNDSDGAHQVLFYCEQVIWEEAWCVSWFESVIVFSVSYQLHMMVMVTHGGFWLISFSFIPINHIIFNNDTSKTWD